MDTEVPARAILEATVKPGRLDVGDTGDLLS